MNKEQIKKRGDLQVWVRRSENKWEPHYFNSFSDCVDFMMSGASNSEMQMTLTIKSGHYYKS